MSFYTSDVSTARRTKQLSFAGAVLFGLICYVFFTTTMLRSPPSLADAGNESVEISESDENIVSYPTKKLLLTEEELMAEEEEMLKNPFSLQSIPLDFSNFSVESEGIYFLHIPKTGGMSLNDELRRAFRDAHMLPNGTVPVSNIRCQRRWDINFAGTSRMMDVYSSYENFQTNFSGCAYGVGHSDIGVVAAVHPRRLHIFTMLREPVARVISLFYFIRSYVHRDRPLSIPGISRIGTNSSNQIQAPKPSVRQVLRSPTALLQATRNIPGVLHDMGLGVVGAYGAFNINTTFEEFYTKMLPKSGADNYMVRAFSGNLRSFCPPDPNGLPLSQYNPRVHNNTRLIDMAPEKAQLMLREAKRFLWNVAPFVGLTEEFSLSMELFSWTTQIHTSDQRLKRNVTPPHASNISVETYAKVAEMETYDALLYNFARKLFDARVKVMQTITKTQYT